MTDQQAPAPIRTRTHQRPPHGPHAPPPHGRDGGCDAAPPRSVQDTVGQTPLLELPRLAHWARLPPGSRLLAKAEHLNPGGSGKDRIALALLERAEARGLRPGGTVVEATSGNTGIALAQLCAAKGYRLHVVASTKVSEEKVRLIQAHGHTVHRVPNVPHGHPDHYTRRAQRLAEELDAYYLDQFHSPSNVQVHERHTGPELLQQVLSLGLEPDVFVAGVGTGGTLTGVARHLRRAAPATRIILADPEGSVLACGGTARPYKVEGIGDDTPPGLYDATLVDGAETVDDRTSFRYALAAARLEGLLVGGSAGTHLAAACLIARRLGPGTVVCTVLPDTGRNYLSTFLDPEWCRNHGFEGIHEEADEPHDPGLQQEVTA